MNKTLKIILIIIAIIIVVGLIWLSGKKPAEKGTIKIGFIAPLTGQVATIGQSTKAAADLAVSEINANGGINGRLLEIIYEDGKCDPKEAVTAVTKLINVDKVSAIIGGECSSETVAAAPIAEQAKVVMFSPLSSNPTLTTAGDYIFRNYPSDSFQGIKSAEFAVNILKSENIAILSCMNDWCQGVKNVFKEKAIELGAKIVIEENFDEATTHDLKTQLTKINSSSPDLIYFLSYTDMAVIGLKQVKEMGISAKILGGDSWSDPKIVSESGSAANGVMYIIPASTQNAQFKEAMLRAGSEITIGAAESYDAVKILAQVIEKAGTDSVKIKNALYKVQNYEGVSGNISFDKNGDLTTANYEIKIIQDGKVNNY